MRPTTVATDLQLAKIQAKKGERFDVKVKNRPGLTVRISSTSKIFRTKITCQQSKRRELVTLGYAHKGMTIAEADSLRTDLRINGKKPKSSLELTIQDVIADFYKAQTSKLKRPETVEDIFNRFIIPLLSSTPLSEVETYTIAQEIDRIRSAHGEEPARKSLCYIAKFYRWCKATGRTPINPVAELNGELYKFHTPKRDRHLSREEVPVLFNAIEQSSIDARSKIGIHILLRTGVRSGELLAAKWEDVNLAANLWFIPGKNTKSGEPISIPLAPQISDYFKALQLITAKTGLVMGGLSRLAITRALTRLQEPNKAGYRALALESKLNVHDLRRSFVTFLNELGVAPHIVEKMVNHKMQGVMAIYNHSELFEERKAAICRLCDALESPLQSLPGKGA